MTLDPSLFKLSQTRIQAPETYPNDETTSTNFNFDNHIQNKGVIKRDVFLTNG